MSKIKVDKEKCIGCGVCVSTCPDIFELGEDGKAQIKEKADLEKDKKCIEEAIQSCPVGAIEKEK